MFIGKESSSYAITSDFDIKDKLQDYPRWKDVDEILMLDAHWWAKEGSSKIKVWTDLKQIKRLFSYGNRNTDDDGNKIPTTYSEYEVLCNNQPIIVDFL